LNFLHRRRIDWDELERETFAQAAGAQTSVDTYPAIRFALAKLGDHHSYLQLSPALQREEATRKPQLANPAAMPPTVPPRTPSFPFPSPFRTRRVPEGAMIANANPPVAEIVVPLFSSSDRKELDAFATKIQGVIGDLVSHDPCGWIVDLRGNGGGNVWGMRAGIGPILGEGSAGGREDADGVKTFSFYASGAAGEREEGKVNAYAAVTGPPVVLTSAPPVAVLIDRETGSSGEGIAIDFRGRPQTRFFGEATYGASTSTFPFVLPDSAQLYLVTAVMIDRAGEQIEFGASPDEEILSEATISNNDPVIRRASQWLGEQTACTSRGRSETATSKPLAR
jgi:carboxyl-terminal processing protease